MKYHLLILLAVVGFVWLLLRASDVDDTAGPAVQQAFNLTEIAEGMYLHQGQHVPFEHAEHDDIANIGFIVGDDCVAVIDTGGSIRVARQLKQAVASISRLPVCYVINTHVHFDHLLGNALFQPEQTEFVGHQNLATAIEDSREFFLREFSAELAEYASAEGIIAPTMLVEDSLQLDLGNRPLTLRAVATAHSDSDLIVIDDATGIAWLGDLLFVERIPALDGSLKGWLAVLEALRGEPFTRAIPGHGPVVDWPQGLESGYGYLSMLLQQVRADIAAGKFMEEIVDAVGKQEKLNWQLHEQHHKRNVTRAFAELEWE